MWVFTPNIDRCPTPSGPGPLGRAAGRAAGPLGQKGMVFFGVSGGSTGFQRFPALLQLPNRVVHNSTHDFHCMAELKRKHCALRSDFSFQRLQATQPKTLGRTSHLVRSASEGHQRHTMCR